jgi:hypothetical protein
VFECSRRFPYREGLSDDGAFVFLLIRILTGNGSVETGSVETVGEKIIMGRVWASFSALAIAEVLFCVYCLSEHASL